MSRLRLRQLAQDGATVGQVPAWTGTTWAPATPSGGSSGGSTSSTKSSTPQGTLQCQYTFASSTEGWTNDIGTMTATGGKLRLTNSVGVNISALEPSTVSNIDDGEFWCDAECVAVDGGNKGSFGLIFRAADANNHYLWDLNFGSAAQINLYKKVSGSYTILRSFTWTFYPPAPGWARFMTRFVGSQIELYCNETLVLFVRDSTFTTGRCGVRATSQTSSSTLDFDNPTVLSLPTGWRPPP